MGLAPPAGSWGHAQRASARALVPPGLWCLWCAAGTAGVAACGLGGGAWPRPVADVGFPTAQWSHSGCLHGSWGRQHAGTRPDSPPPSLRRQTAVFPLCPVSRRAGPGPPQVLQGFTRVEALEGTSMGVIIGDPTLWGTVLPGLALATWCSAGWRDHPPESLSQKVASPHPTARQGPGVPPPPAHRPLPACGCVESED